MYCFLSFFIVVCYVYDVFVPYGWVNLSDAYNYNYMYPIGSKLPIFCDSGYELHGGYGVECTPQGYWNHTATCVKNGMTLIQRNKI